MVIDLDEDYQWTVIGVPSQKYLWIMARTPQISESLYSEIVSRIEDKKYNTQDIKKMPQQWLSAVNKKKLVRYLWAKIWLEKNRKKFTELIDMGIW